MCTHGMVINQHKFASVWLTTCTIDWQKKLIKFLKYTKKIELIN